MPLHRLLDFTNDDAQPSGRLLAALQQWRDTTWNATAESHIPEHRAIEANRATIERATAALMRRFDMNTVGAFSLMVRWARLTHTPVHTLAATLVQSIDEADPQPARRHDPLIRWLEGRLRYAAP